MDFGSLPEHEKQNMLRLIEEKQAKQFLGLFTFVVDNCFNDCVFEFTSTTLSEKESACAKNCTDKILKLTNRIGKRMADKQMMGLPSNP